MEDVMRKIKEEKAFLTALSKAGKQQLTNAPEGRLKVRSKNGKVEYYFVDSQGKEKYLSKNQIELAKALAQKSYLNQFLKDISRQSEIIQQFLSNYSNQALSASYHNLSEQRKKLVNPLYETDEQFVTQWKSTPYVGKGFANNEVEILTEQGERVRSKSEKMIADKLFMMGIPYKYECPLHLDRYGVVYPDFTLLKVNSREEVYMEHFGMMDNSDYASKAINKIDTYIRNGYVPGKNLLLTYETAKKPLDMNVFEICVSEILK